MLMTMEPTQPAAEKPRESSRPCYQILLVSDDAIFIEAIAAAIRVEGHVPTIVSSGEEALHCIHSQHYDLVAAKFDLPRMNGEELAGWVKALLPRQPFILVMNERDCATPDQRSAADVVLRKPFTLQEAREVFYKLVE
jgi:CitB family two-component system response regulator MalR